MFNSLALLAGNIGRFAVAFVRGIRVNGTADSEGIYPLLPGQTPPIRTPAIAIGANYEDGFGQDPPTQMFNGITTVVYNRSVTPVGQGRSVNVNPLRVDVGVDFAHGASGQTPADNADSTAFRWQGMGGNRPSTLNGGIDATTTTITVNVGTNTGYWPLTSDVDPDPDTRNLWSEDLALIIGDATTNELVIPTAFDRVTGILTGCERGARSTTTQAWSNGTTVTLYRMTTYAAAQYWNHSNTVGNSQGSIRFFTQSGSWDAVGEKDERAKVAEFTGAAYADQDGNIVGLGVSVPNQSAISTHPGASNNLPIRVGKVYATIDSITASVASDGAGTGTGTMTVTASSLSGIVVGAQVDWGASVVTRVIAFLSGSGGTGTYRVSLQANVGSASATVYDPAQYIGPGIYANNQTLAMATNNGTDTLVLRASGLHSSPGWLQLGSGTAAPAGGTQDFGLRFSSANHFGIFFGSGAPTLAAGQGSFYLRIDGSTTNDRAYINTDGNTTWTAVTTAA